MFIAITGDPVLDFVIIFLFIICRMPLTSDKVERYNAYIREMPIPPVISWR